MESDLQGKIFKIATALLALFLIIAIAFAVWLKLSNKDLSNNVASLNEQVSTLNGLLSLQQSTSDIKLLDENTFGQIGGDILNANAIIYAAGQDREAEIRTVFKTVTIRNECIPVSVSDRLLDYAYSLRARAMYPDQPIPDGANTNPSTGGCLTYENAVTWIDKLLTSLDTANMDKEGIRKQESVRKANYNQVTDVKNKF